MRNTLTPAEAATLNQGVPEKGTGPAIINLVLDDIKDYPDTLKSSFIIRAAKGEMQYTYPLQAKNGRDALYDAWQEALDYAMYLRQYVEELILDGLPVAAVLRMYTEALGNCKDIHDMIKEREKK